MNWKVGGVLEGQAYSEQLESFELLPRYDGHKLHFTQKRSFRRREPQRKRQGHNCDAWICDLEMFGVVIEPRTRLRKLYRIGTSPTRPSRGFCPLQVHAIASLISTSRFHSLVSCVQMFENWQEYVASAVFTSTIITWVGFVNKDVPVPYLV